VLSSLLVALLSCDGSSDEPRPTWPCEPGQRSEVSFDPEHMLCVRLEMAPEDFVALSEQFRFGDDAEDQFPGVLGHAASSCTEPFPDPYEYFPADVVVDGLEATEVGVRKKGFVGSVLNGSVERPSLKVKTDHYVEDQTLAGTERLTLNNNLTDESRMRTCLVYSVFEDAGYPAPRCNLANVMVNGESLGAYTHVEAVKKDFLRWAFDNDDGSLYEATLADFTDTHLAEGLGRWEAKTDDTETSPVLLQGVADALAVDDEDLEAALEEVLDLEMFLTFWALETLVAHGDGYASNTNNTYVYFDPDRDDRAVLLPWGPDDAFRGEEPYGFVTSALARRLSRHPELSRRYLDALEALLLEVWDEDVLAGRIAVFTEHIGTAEQDLESQRAAAETLVGWVMGRRQVVERFIADGGQEGDEESSGCNGGLNLSEFAELAELMVVFSHSCSATPGRSEAAWVLAALILALRRRECRPERHSAVAHPVRARCGRSPTPRCRCRCPCPPGPTRG